MNADAVAPRHVDAFGELARNLDKGNVEDHANRTDVGPPEPLAVGHAQQIWQRRRKI